MTTIEQAPDQEEYLSPLPYGPLLESTRVSAGLDYYKPTMSQLAYEQAGGEMVTFTFHNRGEQRLMDYVDPDVLSVRFEQIRQQGFSHDELKYLASIKDSDGYHVFSPFYCEYLESNELPAVNVAHDEKTDDIAISTIGDWPMVTFWETIVMSEVNEAYFEGYLVKHGLDPLAVYDEGDRRLSEKITALKDNPDIKFADFGTRRHFSFRWQKHVLERLQAECPDNFVGTSNVALAESLGVKPIGTFAHEMPMVYAGVAEAIGRDVRLSHHRFLEDWYDRYGEDYSIALTDTFTTDFFFSDFTPEQAKNWRGVRQDSGDPYAFGERLINFYEDLGIDPTTKTAVFSDGLDIDTIVSLEKHFHGRINILFGWGTSLTNDLGIKALNIVMKATRVDLPGFVKGAYTVKLSDDPSKHTGREIDVKHYQEIFGGSQ